MSYRLITKATLTITSATGTPFARDIEVRAYPSPKRDASGAITVDGVSASYKRTGGKGRGTSDNRYMYFPAKGESAYCAITDDEAMALIGGNVTVVSAAPVAPVAPVAGSEPTSEPIAAPAPTLTRTQRRAAKQTA